MTRAAAAQGTAAPALDTPNRAPVLPTVNVEKPKEVSWRGKAVYTGVWKHQVAGPRMARRLNIDEDGQSDTTGHGGEQRAVLVYQVGSYRYWERHFGRDDFSYGQFGENLTVDGLPDDEVCIGYRYRIGEAEFEVTQPRVTCYRVGMRLGEPALPALLVAHHRPGFYVRVISEGSIQAGDAIVKTRTGPGGVSVAGIDALLYRPGRDPDKLRAAVGIPALSRGRRDSFRHLVSAAEGHADATLPSPGAGPAPRLESAWLSFCELRVSKVVQESEQVSSVYLAEIDGTALPAAQAGQYLALRIRAAGQPGPSAQLSGDITYTPVPLEPPADGRVLICCARPGTDIVLDM
jgi:MOSC domain-containing protein YiiM